MIELILAYALLSTEPLHIRAPGPPYAKWDLSLNVEKELSKGVYIQIHPYLKAGDLSIRQKLVGSMVKGKKYRLIFKAQAVTGATAAGGLSIYIRNFANSTSLDTDWDTNAFWLPAAIGTSASWFISPDLVPEFSTDNPEIVIFGIYANRGAATAIKIDEVYLWEIVDVVSILAFNHNWNGSTTLDIWANYCNRTRTNFSASEQTRPLENGIINTSGPYSKEFSSTKYPVYQIILDANTNYQYEAGQIMLCEKWLWARHPKLTWDPYKTRKEEKRITTRGGQTTFVEYYQKAMVGPGTVEHLTTAERDLWLEWKRFHHDNKDVFAFVFDTGFDPILVYDLMTKFGTPYTGARPMVNFEFEEAK